MFRHGLVAHPCVIAPHTELVPPFAPRYPDELYALLERIDDERLTLAEVARRVGDAAQQAGMTRPSPVHVRRLIAELRRLREDDREIRRAALEAALGGITYRAPHPYEVEEAAARASDRIELRERRRRR